MDTLLDCVLIIGGSTFLSLAGMLVVRRSVSREKVEACHEVGGFLLSVVGTLYAILVGLIVVSSQAKVDSASDMAVTEANMLSNIYHLATTFKEPTGANIRDAVHDYAEIAVTQNWAEIVDGKAKEGTIPTYQRLWHAVTGYVPIDSRDSQCYATMLGNLEELSAARKYRMIVSRGGLSPILWSVLIAGGVMIVAFTYFFYLESLAAQTLMTACVAIFLSMNVYLIYVCQNPYRAELGAKDAGFGPGFNVNWFKDKHPASHMNVHPDAVPAHLSTQTPAPPKDRK